MRIGLSNTTPEQFALHKAELRRVHKLARETGVREQPKKICLPPEEIARRREICEECEDAEWYVDSDNHPLGVGCKLIPAFERKKLTAYKQEHGHCARGCHAGKRKW